MSLKCAFTEFGTDNSENLPNRYQIESVSIQIVKIYKIGNGIVLVFFKSKLEAFWIISRPLLCSLCSFYDVRCLLCPKIHQTSLKLHQVSREVSHLLQHHSQAHQEFSSVLRLVKLGVTNEFLELDSSREQLPSCWYIWIISNIDFLGDCIIFNIDFLDFAFS